MNCPSVVILDLIEPGKNGLNLLRKIKRRAPACEVIIVSAFGETAILEEAMAAGAFDFLNKPVKRKAILDAVQRASKKIKESAIV